MEAESTVVTESARGIFKYLIRSRDDRMRLAAQLKQTVSIAFDSSHHPLDELHAELPYLDEALTLLSREHDQTIVVRRKGIQESLYQFFDLMDEIRLYSAEQRNYRTEGKLRKALRKLIDQITTLTSLRLSRSEEDMLHTLDLSAEKLQFYIRLKRISPYFYSIFEGAFYKSPATQKDLTIQQLRLSILNQFSPELVSAYQETDNLLTEAESLAHSPEDEYFVEQVTKDYYPSIFETLQTITNESADFNQKEIAVSESLKQFKIIQLGLHKIIDSTIANNLSTMKSQTDFLRNKVMGNAALSLTPNELDLAVDSNVEEAQRLREELYLKHVAPQIEEYRQYYETQLAEMQAIVDSKTAEVQQMKDELYPKHVAPQIELNRMEYDAKIAEMQKTHEAELKTIAVQNLQYKDELRKIRAEEKIESLRSNYPTPPFRRATY